MKCKALSTLDYSRQCGQGFTFHRRLRRQSPFSATTSTVAEFGDCRWIRRQIVAVSGDYIVVEFGDNSSGQGLRGFYDTDMELSSPGSHVVDNTVNI